MSSSGALCPYPTVCRLGVACPLRVVRSPVAFLVATPPRPPAAALPVWTFCGAQYLGKTATLVPSRWSFARKHMLDTLADWWGLQRHCGSIGGRGLFAPQLTYPGSSREQGSRLPHSHGPAPLAPVVADREGAHGRVNSDHAVDRPCSRLIRPQGPHPRTTAWRSCPRRSHAVLLVSDTQWTASSTAGRFWLLGGSVKGHPGRETRPEREAVQEGGPHPSHRASLCAAVLSTYVLTVLHLGSGCRTTARTSSGRAWLALDQRPPCWNGSRPFRMQGQRTRWTPVKQYEVPCGINPRTAHVERKREERGASHSSLSSSSQQHP